MIELFDGFKQARWPRPADLHAAARERERWLEAARLADDAGERLNAQAVAADPIGSALLAAVFGNSPYLSDALTRDLSFAIDLLRRGPDMVFHDLIGSMAAAGRAADSRATLMRDLRIAKRRSAAAIALADIAGVWPVAQVTAALTRFAETAVGLSAEHLLREAAAAGALRLRNPANPCEHSGLVIIGMGKLGACELNYSSDIDLIILFDPERIDTADPDRLQKTFVRLARGLVQILDERGPEGYVLRTDLRLRPDPASTPLAISVEAAELYYESLGQNWERAAMIKARPIAGDLAAGNDFLRRLTPYVWRKHLDFAAIQDIHSIKRQINAHRGGGTVALKGHNIKVGRGGIREIEFFAQTQQLIWGGREPSLRERATCPAIMALAGTGRVERDAARELVKAYEFLRRVEHRLQMVNDEQTHTLPASDDGLEAIATFLGYSGADAFGSDMLRVLRTVERHYAALFEESPSLASSGNLVFTGTEDDPATLETLRAMGFEDVAMVAATIRGWHHGRYRAMRSVRARELLTELMPQLLRALAANARPDGAFRRFDEFLGRLPAGVQLFSLFHANPGLLGIVAEIMGTAPRLAEALSRYPQILDSVLMPDFMAGLPAKDHLRQDLARMLGQARDFQDVLDTLRRWKNERTFQVGFHLLQGGIDAEAAGAGLSNVADVVIMALHDAVEREFAAQHGTVPGGELIVIALGKLGGREMTFASDLDLILLYDAPPDVEGSDGLKPLPVSLYYTRLSNRFINGVTALTGEGRLYEIDMRLRPSGTKGPIATSFQAFSAYHRESSWTWEHMALTRARIISGPADLRSRAAGEIRRALTRPRDPAILAAEVADMRSRMAAEHRPANVWDVKHWRGGLIDVEFIAQFLQLRHASERPEILDVGTAGALMRLKAAGYLPEADASVLLGGLRLCLAVQALLRLLVEGPFDPRTAPSELGPLIARRAGAVDFERLEAAILECTAAVMQIYTRLLPETQASGGSKGGG